MAAFRVGFGRFFTPPTSVFQPFWRLPMTRGIQLKSLTATDLGHLGLPADSLESALEMLEDMEIGHHLPDPRAVTREVRATLEEALALLTEALPADLR
jgi:hypothetical protein